MLRNWGNQHLYILSHTSHHCWFCQKVTVFLTIVHICASISHYDWSHSDNHSSSDHGCACAACLLKVFWVINQDNFYFWCFKIKQMPVSELHLHNVDLDIAHHTHLILKKNPLAENCMSPSLCCFCEMGETSQSQRDQLCQCSSFFWWCLGQPPRLHLCLYRTTESVMSESENRCEQCLCWPGGWGCVVAAWWINPHLPVTLPCHSNDPLSIFMALCMCVCVCLRLWEGCSHVVLFNYRYADRLEHWTLQQHFKDRQNQTSKSLKST